MLTKAMEPTSVLVAFLHFHPLTLETCVYNPTKPAVGGTWIFLMKVVQRVQEWCECTVCAIFPVLKYNGANVQSSLEIALHRCTG